MQQQARLSIWRELRKRALELLRATLEVELGRHISLMREPLVYHRISDIDGLRCRCLVERVLMQHMTRKRKEIRFGAANLVVMRDAQQPQEDFLGEIRCISRISQARRQIAPQLAPVVIDDFVKE